MLKLPSAMAPFIGWSIRFRNCFHDVLFDPQRTSIPFASKTSWMIHDDVTVIVCFTKPNKDAVSSREYVSHHLNLVIALLEILFGIAQPDRKGLVKRTTQEKS